MPHSKESSYLDSGKRCELGLLVFLSLSLMEMSLSDKKGQGEIVSNILI